MSVNDLDRVRQIARAALASLEASRRRIDDLNVYPVPDGDTGTNLTLTGRAIVEDLDRSTASDRPTIAREVTRSALMGARGNSGVILSQIVRGAAEALAESDGEDAIVGAFRSAANAAYRAVRHPVEGTMLSAIRALADEAERRPDDFWPSLIRAGEAAVARTQEQLDVLRDAGVVDAGAAGLLEIVRGIAAAITGEEIAPIVVAAEPLTVDAIHQELSRYRYCTTFVIEGDGLDADALEHELEQLGDSLLVVGDSSALKVHVHTDDPGAALSLGTNVGVVERVEIANMHEQTQEREQRLLEAVPDAGVAVVAVVAGDGNRALFESLGASQIVEGGQTMNPSTSDLVLAIDSAPAREIVVLPNNANVVMTAEQAGRLASKPTEIVPTESLQAGLAAMVAFDPDRSAADNAADMRETVDAVATGEITVASRDAQLNGVAVREGEFLGLVGDEPVASGIDFDAVADAVVARLLAEPRGVMTLLTGAEEPNIDALLGRLRDGHPDLELDVQRGGQPHYPLLLSAE